MKKISAVLITVFLLTNAVCAYAEPSPSPEVSQTPSAEATVLPSASPEASPKPSPEASPNVLPTASPSASPTALPTATPSPEELSKQFVLTIDVTPQKHIIPNNAEVELYSDSGELLAKGHRYVGWDTPYVTMTFDVPEYHMGEKFKVKLVSGLRSLKNKETGVYVEAGGELEVTTYGYINDEGKYTQCNGAVLAGNPHYDKDIRVYAGGKWLTDLTPHARIKDGIAMIPVRAIGEAMGLNVNYNQENDSVSCSIGESEVVFYANNIYATILGVGVNAPHETVYMEGALFVPMRTLAEAFESLVEVADYGSYMDILIGESPIIQEFRNRTPVNRDGIGSRTNYLVWVSKHEYKVRVYEGAQYRWNLLKEFPCALGAWNTPTITGQFEYIERTQWNYDGYYVGPVLRFHNGYALHSTLLYYGGGEYDGRVGVNISHGCVRLHPEDINWIANTIPFRTRIYITE